jgi:hypothetical protein
MPAEFIDSVAIEEVVTFALRKFARRDKLLLHLKVFEATLAHRVGVYIEQKLPRWHVDCEYNRNLRANKMRSDGANGMRPDIVAHIRNTTSNLLFVEIKKTSHATKQKNVARERVRDMTALWRPDYPRYAHGVVLIFPVQARDLQEIICEWSHREGSTAALTGGAPQVKTIAVPLQ